MTAATAVLGDKTRYWLGRIARFSLVQGLAQVFSLAGGFLIVRTFSKSEYALYSIAIALQSVMSVLSDSGVGTGLMSIGGRVYQHRHRFGQLLRTAFEIRHIMAVISVLAVAPMLFVMLIGKGGGVWYSLAIVLAVLVGAFFQLTNSLFGVVVRLHAQLVRIQTLDFWFAFTKFLFIASFCLFFLNSFFVLAVFAVMFGAQSFMLRRWALEKADLGALPNEEDRSEIIRTIRSILPNSIFYCLQGQISLFLISFFGRADQVADVAAIGRLAALFTVITIMVNNIVIPYFSRCRTYRELVARYVNIMSGYVFVQALFVSLVLFFPAQLLWVLGGKYAYLRQELVLIVMSTSLYSIAGLMWGLNSARGWVKWSWANIPVTVLTQIALLAVLDVSQVKGVILFGLFSSVPSLAVFAVISMRGFAAFKSGRMSAAPAL